MGKEPFACVLPAKKRHAYDERNKNYRKPQGFLDQQRSGLLPFIPQGHGEKLRRNLMQRSPK